MEMETVSYSLSSDAILDKTLDGDVGSSSIDLHIYITCSDKVIQLLSVLSELFMPKKAAKNPRGNYNICHYHQLRKL